MGKVRINSLVRLFVLVQLAEKPTHGYDLIQKTGLRLGKRVSAGEIYPFLRLLKKKRLVREEKEGGRDKTVYSLNSEGKKLVKSLLEKFDSIAETIIQQKVRQCAHCDCEIYHGGFEKTIHGKKMLFCCEHCAKAMRSHAH